MGQSTTMTTPAVRSGSRARPLAEVKERAARLAAGLTELGLRHGDRYVVMMRNETAFLEASAAGGLIGAMPVPVNWHWHGTDLRHLLHDCGARLAIVHSDFVPAVESHAPDDLEIVEAEVPEEVRESYGLGTVPVSGKYVALESLIERHEPIAQPNADPPHSVIYTSGTTGFSKGILRSAIPRADMPKVLTAAQTLFKLNRGASTLLPAPLYHTAPNAHAVFAMAFDMDITVMPRFDPIEFLQIIERRRIDTVQVVPIMFRRLLQLPADVRKSYDLSSLRAIVHAAAPCPPDVKRAMIDWVGPIVYEYYGGSEEGAWVMCDSAEALAHPGTVGRPFLGSDVRVLDDDGNPVPAGVPGVIYGKAVDGWPDFTYIHDEQKRRDIERDGYITVGDIGYLDQEGYLYLCDRISDMVISGGVNIYPAEIEACLVQLDGVADVAVFGIPDAEYGEALAAHIQLLPGARVTENDVRDFVGRNLARYKVPRVVVFDDNLPREDSGKLFKRELKARYWQQL